MTTTNGLLIRELKYNHNIGKEKARAILNTIFGTIKIMLQANESVTIRGFGRWVIRKPKTKLRKSRITGKIVKYTYPRKITFEELYSEDDC